MASLALVVSLIVLVLLVSGPLCWMISKIKCIPNIVIYMLSLLCIAMGLWFVFLPIPATRYMGIIPIYFGYLSFSNRYYGNLRNNNN